MDVIPFTVMKNAKTIELENFIRFQNRHKGCALFASTTQFHALSSYLHEHLVFFLL
jgi:hypothetical protein